jgi:hypothetical protein
MQDHIKREIRTLKEELKVIESLIAMFEQMDGAEERSQAGQKSAQSNVIEIPLFRRNNLAT